MKKFANDLALLDAADKPRHGGRESGTAGEGKKKVANVLVLLDAADKPRHVGGERAARRGKGKRK